MNADEKLQALLAQGSVYLTPVYPGESLESWQETLADAQTGTASPNAPMMNADSVIWTNLDGMVEPSSVHGEWAAQLTAEVPDWHRQDVRIYPFLGGSRVATPGGKVETLEDGGYVVEQTGLGTTTDGEPYKVYICHVMFVKDGRVVRNHQYWGSPDDASMVVTNRTLAATRGQYAEREDLDPT